MSRTSGTISLAFFVVGRTRYACFGLTDLNDFGSDPFLNVALPESNAAR